MNNENETLKEKVENYNTSVEPGQQIIDGCVLIMDTKIPDSKIAEGIDNGVYCWDNRHLSFLAAKCRLWVDWTPEDRRRRSRRAFNEEEIEQYVTSFKVIKSKEDYSDALIAIFHHSPFEVLSVSEAQRILENVIQPVKDYANREALDTFLHLRMHVAGEIQSGLLNDFNEILVDYVDDFVKIQMDACGINYYACAPWASFLP